MLKTIFDNIRTGMEKAVEHTKIELKKVRTGRANPILYTTLSNLFSRRDKRFSPVLPLDDAAFL